MSFLFNYAKPIEPTPEETIDKLADRIMSSTLIEDRRASVLGLKGLTRDYKLVSISTEMRSKSNQQVGTKGMIPLIKVLKNDNSDLEIVKSVLDTLTLLCTAVNPKDKSDLGIMFTEIYSKDPANVTLLLDILEDSDFYIRFNTVQLIQTLYNNLPLELEDCILTSPIGMSRLIDLLDDKREIIRNEGLLLLLSLSQSNANIQKIIAFENAFDRLMTIIIDENATDGGIIVQDCLNLTLNLLKYNNSNQNLFRENSFIQRIPYLLISKVADKGRMIDSYVHDPRVAWNTQKTSNTILILELCRILVIPNNHNTIINQNTMSQCNLLPLISSLAFGDHVPPKIQRYVRTFILLWSDTKAYITFGDMIRANPDIQNNILKYAVDASPSPDLKPKKTQLLNISMDDFAEIILVRDDSTIASAALYLFEQCLIHDNHELQVQIAMGLANKPSLIYNIKEFRKTIFQVLFDLDDARKRPMKPWLASIMLSYLLMENENVKGVLQGCEIQDGVDLLTQCGFSMILSSKEGFDQRVAIGYLTLLSIWLHDHPISVQSFLSENSHGQFLIEKIVQSSNVASILPGLNAFLFSICMEYNNDLEPSFTKSNMQALVSSRIGLDVFKSSIDRLKNSKLTQSPTSLLNMDENNPEALFDGTFLDLFKSNVDMLVKSAMSKNGKNAKKEAEDKEIAISRYLETIQKQQDEINALKTTLSDVQLSLTNENLSLKHAVEELKSRIVKQDIDYRELVKEQEDLLVCLAEQDGELSEYKDRLRKHGEQIDD